MTEFNAMNTLKTLVAGKLTDAGVELTEKQQDVLVTFMVQNRMLKVDKLVDLNQFVHFETDEVPAKSLVVNNLIVYLFESEVEVREHENAYQNYLENEELYEHDLSYGEFIDQAGLTGEVRTETVVNVSSTRVGDVFFGFLKEQKQLTQRATFVGEKLETLKGVVGDNFISGLQL